MARITFNEKDNEALGLTILNDITHEIASNDIETIEIDGRDGVLLVDKQRLKPVEKSFNFILREDVPESTTPIGEWLMVKGWQDLELSWDNDYLYRATVINQLNIDEVLRQFGKLRVVFLVQPIKLLKDSLQSKPISNGGTVVNRGNLPAKPIIELTGYGDTVLTINGRKTPLEDVQGSIKLDMFHNVVSSGNLSAWEKVVYERDADKPYLDVGNNTISWSGDFTASITTMEGVRV